MFGVTLGSRFRRGRREEGTVLQPRRFGFSFWHVFDGRKKRQGYIWGLFGKD